MYTPIEWRLSAPGDDMKRQRERIRIALLTPYTGGNLGDAAIQEAVISNYKMRYRNADIHLITMCPEQTSRLHRVPSFPIDRSAVSRNSLSFSLSGANTDGKGAILRREPESLRWVKTFVKKFALRFPILMQAYGFASTTAQGCRLIHKEMMHIAIAYRFMRGFDFLVASGGGQLDDYWGGPWEHPYALLKWGLIARAVGARFIFLSVGTCSLETRLSMFFIRHALKLADYRSYRDQVSKQLLGHLTFTQKDAIYPDLAFSYDIPKALEEQNKPQKPKTVGVSPIAYLSKYSWPKKDLSVYEEYRKHLVLFVEELLLRGYSIVLFSTDIPDRHVVDEIFDILLKKVGPEAVERLYNPRTHTLEELFAQLSKVNYVVASRLHGILLSHLAYIPVLAISYDRKVDTYMEEIGLSNYCQDIHKLSTKKLIDGFEAMVCNSFLVESRVREITEDYARKLVRQYELALEQ